MTAQLCRICRRPEGRILLQEKYETKSTAEYITFLEAFNECTHLGADFKDAHPQLLCLLCSQELQQCHDFLLRVKISDAYWNIERRGVRATRAYKRAEELRVETMLEEVVGETAMQIVAACEEKDPLEETDDEIEFKVEEEHLNALPTGECNSDYDEDDNKPLKELISIKDNDQKPIDKKVDEDDEDNFAEDKSDIILSVEEQIFPKGRHKCQICERSYFTLMGFNAHMVIHQPESVLNAKKRKRTCATNRKKRKLNAAVSTSVADVEEPLIKVEEQPLPTVDIKIEVNNDEEDETKPPPRARKVKEAKPKKVFPCQVCGKHMISASKLRYHMVMHTGAKDYLCTMCPNAYSTIYALKHHIKTHTGDRPYECQFCGDRFLRPTTLKSHIRRHTGERPYGCDICGKRFIQHSSMTTHIKLNHMAKTIPCPHCDKKYARQTDLNMHLLSHTGDKPFSCKLCPSRFIRQSNLNKHVNQHHHGGKRERTEKCNETKSTAKETTRRNKKPSKAATSAAEIDLGLVSDAIGCGGLKSSAVSALSTLAQQTNVLSASSYNTEFLNHQHLPQTLQKNCIPLSAAATNSVLQQTLQNNLFGASNATTTFLANSVEEDLQHWNWPHGT